MREIKFKYVVEYEGSHYITRVYEWDKYFGLPCKEKIIEELEESYGCDGSCRTPSCDHCECEPYFDPDDWEDINIIDQLQYTGIEDKNGQEIYERDIVRHYGGQKTLVELTNVVEFKNGLLLPFYEMNCKDYDLWNYYIDEYEFEKIGNVYENPELLEDIINE